MAEEITLDTLMQAKGSTALQKQEPVDVQSIRTQVEVLTPVQRARVEELKNSINLMDSQTTIQYGVGAQRNISSFSDHILAQVRSKDSGYVGELMSELVLKVKDAGVDQLEDGPLDKIPFLKNASRAVKRFMQRYESWRCRSTTSSSSWNRRGCRCSRISLCSMGCMKKIWNIFRNCRFILRPARKN